jgi:bisphosphoglycerate-independent phosphoglycerate mutase (AlkP superfamily)
MYKNKPILLVVMDGIGFSETGIGDAVTMAHTPVLDKLLAECASSSTRLKAHGAAVGLPSDDDMGNSEVGHNALGCIHRVRNLSMKRLKAGNCSAGKPGMNLLIIAKTARCTL